MVFYSGKSPSHVEIPLEAGGALRDWLESDMYHRRVDTPTMMKISALIGKELPSPPRSPYSGRSMARVAADPGVVGSRQPAATAAAAAAVEERNGLRGMGRPLQDEQLLLEDANKDSFRASIRLAVIIGQCFSLLPVSTRPNIVPRFRFLSLRVLYCALVTFGLFLNTALSFIDVTWVQSDSDSITSSSRWMFYGSATSVSVMYFRLAMQWRSLCLCFLRVESRMRQDGFPPHLGLRLKAITIAVLSLALMENALAQLSGIMQMDLAKYHSSYDFFKDLLTGSFRHMLLISPYNPLVFGITQALNIFATLMWNYNDLFIMLVSVAIAQRFKLLNKKLLRAPKKEKTTEFWKDAREKYNALSVLTREVDRFLSIQILFSFMNNFYFLCIQLLHTVNHEENTVVKNIYFIFSFGFLIIRTVFVSLFAASIHDESKNVKKELYSVSSNSYCQEVERFIIQATTDDVALSGFNFFSVTRSLLLTIFGTIATYEIVLVQFSGNNS